jgi:hypothetical protein
MNRKKGEEIAKIGVIIPLFVLLTFLGCSSQKFLIEKDTEVEFSMSNELKEVFYYASLAPNGHNTQMWKIGVSNDEKTLKIFIDSSRLLPVVDPNGRESLISAGAFLENMKRALTAFGYEYTLNVLDTADIKNNPLIAEINILARKEQEIDYETLEIIEKRHTDKSKYLKKLLDNQAVKRLLDYSQKDFFVFYNGSNEYDYIQRITLLANELQARLPAAREELATWLRFSDKEAIEKADGLPAEQLGLKGIIKSLYYLTTNRESAKKESFGRSSIKLAKGQLENCAAFFVITGENSVKGYIEAGMKMEAIWLKATEENISIHPMSQALEEEETSEKIVVEFKQNGTFQMIMRAGYVKKYGMNNRIRRPLHEFVFIE